MMYRIISQKKRKIRIILYKLCSGCYYLREAVFGELPLMFYKDERFWYDK